MPKVEDIFTKLNGAKYFPTLNLCNGYHHLPLDEDSILKTAFTSAFGEDEYLKVPFGLALTPADFQELMYKVLKDLPFTIAYLDDIVIYSKMAEHLNYQQQVFHKHHGANLSMKLRQVPLLHQGNSIFGPYPQHNGYKATTFKNSNY